MTKIIQHIPMIPPLGDEYIDKEHGIKLLYTQEHRWRSYAYPSGDVIQALTTYDVLDFLVDSDYEFEKVK